MPVRAALAGLLLTAYAQAQTPGYVVQAPGDTLRGLITDVPDVVAGQRVQIVPEGASEARTYAAGDALAYGDAQGRRYAARTVPVEAGGSPSAYFLQEIVAGPLTLYVLQVRGGGEPVYYVARSGGEPEGLFVARSPVAVPGRAGTLEVRNLYQTTLARATYDCPDVQARAARADLDRRDLVRLVGDYNECVGAERGAADVVATRRRSDLRFSVAPMVGVGVGYLSRSDGTFRSGGASEIPAPGFRAAPQAPLPYVGVVLQVDLLQVSAGSSLTLGVAYQRKSETPDEFRIPAPDRFGRLLAEDVFGNNFLTTTVGYQLSFVGPGVAPYVGVGVVNGFVLDPQGPANAFVTPGPTTESGVYLQLGAETGGFSLGVHAERTALGKVVPLPVFRGGGIYKNTAFTVTLGRRFVLG